jgi:uncharacterized membrane protein (UPF0127 family)
MGKFGAAVILVLSAEVATSGCAPGTVELRGAAGTVMRFSVELADDEAEREVGLMNRDRMAMSAGMLFAYDAPRHVYFWMKNTLIPLDMVFADASGQVTQVHSNALPLDETPIDGGVGVTYVLEINGGLAARLGLAKGAVMRSGVLDQTQSVWRCDE